MTIKEIVNSNIARQVKFYNGEGMSAGIMIGDIIICGCCGGVIEVEDIIEDAREDGVIHPILMYTHWVGLSNEITGDEENSTTTIPVEVEDM